LMLSYEGAYGQKLNETVQGNDIVLAAARSANAGNGQLVLEKNLPLMAGMGGGSADAAAVLRLFSRLQDKQLTHNGLELGSDVPVCLLSKAAWMRGRGENVQALTSFPKCPAVLVNIGIDMPTSTVFERFSHIGVVAAKQDQLREGFDDLNALFAYVQEQGNDLLEPALSLSSEIGRLVEAIHATNAKVAGMSGSGSTCYGLYDSSGAANEAAARLGHLYPEAFVHSTVLQ